jgi:glyoxylase-like metal-dependent hydrolase (beta-lactamase superfamily II)/rhodanese-related sulfurtransferase
MIFRQITHDDLGCASYLIGDEDAGVAAVVDPKLDIEEYLALARYMGVRIEHILETHNHADHVSGHGRLAAATGAHIHIHRLARADYEHEPFDDGWELDLGRVVVRALHTPGHRPEHTAFALVDTARGPEPWAVLTGDTLFVGDIARPDLAVDKEEGAHGIFRSLRDKLLTLPDECEVWPGHLGGSLCGGPGMDMKVSSTIAYERAHNELLRVDDEAAFVHGTTSTLGPQPPNFQAIVALNRGPLHSRRSDVEPLTPRQVELKRTEAALLVDVRTDLQFDDAHIPGAVCNPAVRAGFGTKLAWIARRDQPVVFVGRDDEDARRAVALAAAVGITNIAGYLAGGMTSWREEKRRPNRCSGSTSPRCTSAGARFRCSTCGSSPSGTPATSPAPSMCPTTTSTASRRPSIPPRRSPRSAPPASAALSPRHCCSVTAPSASSTSPTAVSGRGGDTAGRSSRPTRPAPAGRRRCCWPPSRSDWPSASPSECSAAAGRCSPYRSWCTCSARACTRPRPPRSSL